MRDLHCLLGLVDEMIEANGRLLKANLALTVDATRVKDNFKFNKRN